MSDNYSKQCEALKARIIKSFPEIKEKQKDKLALFCESILENQSKLALISDKTVQTIDLVHFADGIMASLIIQKTIQNTDLYDLGSGNGLPGIIYGILFPQTKVTLVEMDIKRVEFLKSVVERLELANINVINNKIEGLAAQSVQYAVCRDVGTVTKVLLMVRTVVKKGGIVFHLKGEEWPSEIADIPTQLCSHWQPLLFTGYKLPNSEVSRAVVKTEKIAE